MTRRMWLELATMVVWLVEAGCAPPHASDEEGDASDESSSGESGDEDEPDAPTGLGTMTHPLEVGGDRWRSAVASSAYTTCLLADDGVPRCMGEDDPVPIPLAGLDRVVSIRSSPEYYYALRADGTLWHWSPFGVDVPEQVPGADRFRALTQGNQSHCAVRTDGRLACAFGDDPLALVPGLTDVVAADANYGYGAAIRANGEVWAWGYNDDGQLGTDDVDESAIPLKVSGIAGAVAIASNGHATCAVLEGGDVKCWGLNHDGALGNGDLELESSSTPVSVLGVDDAVDIVDSHHAGKAWQFTFCVTRVDGDVTCWGSHFGAPTPHPTLHDVGHLTSSEFVQLTAILADGTAVQTGTFGDSTSTPIAGFDTGLVTPRVATGTRHSCALRSNGTVACWGQNTQGELGNGSTTNSSTPVAVSGLDDVIDIAASSQHTCAVLRDGTARCWGRNNEDQLGDGGAAFPFSTTPVVVAGLDDVVAIAPTAKSTCALREGGEVVCWGVNTSGQLGDGTLIDHAVPAPVTGLADAVAISGSDHYCAVRANGRVLCWGRGNEGQIGNGQSGAGADKTVPTTVRTSILSTLEGAIAVSTGNATSCAVRANGTTYCWGADPHGLGNGAAGVSQVYAAQVSGVTTAFEVAMGSSAQCVLLATGDVRCFGTNTYGEIGSWLAPLGTDRLTPVAVGSLFSPLLSVLAIDSGDDHSCAMLATGQVKCWGLNGHGQLGDGTTTNRATPVTVVGLP